MKNQPWTLNFGASGMKEIPIIYSIDDNYAPHCAASIASVLLNLSDEYFANIYIITDSLSAENCEKIEKTTKLKKCSLTFINIDPKNSEFGRFELPPPWTRSILYRLKAPSILKNCSKAIYLDADTIVTGNIGELFSMDITNYALGAVDEREINPSVTQLHSERLNLPPSFGYFNSGVLLLNLNKMREEDIEQKCLDLLNSDDRILLKYPDQDALNIAVNGQFLHLPKTWNFASGSIDVSSLAWRFKKLPKVIHFCGPFSNKPWIVRETLWSFIRPKVPYSEQYFKYLAYTPWKNTTPKQNMLRKFVALIQHIGTNKKRNFIPMFGRSRK